MPDDKPKLTPAEWIEHAKILAEQNNIPVHEQIQATVFIVYGKRLTPEEAKELANA